MNIKGQKSTYVRTGMLYQITMADNQNNWLFSSYPSGNSECVGVVGHRATGAGGTFRSAVQKQLFRKGFATNTVVSLLELFFS